MLGPGDDAIYSPHLQVCTRRNRVKNREKNRNTSGGAFGLALNAVLERQAQSQVSPSTQRTAVPACSRPFSAASDRQRSGMSVKGVSLGSLIRLGRREIVRRHRGQCAHADHERLLVQELDDLDLHLGIGACRDVLGDLADIVMHGGAHAGIIVPVMSTASARC
jgi:hypothetical protein